MKIIEHTFFMPSAQVNLSLVCAIDHGLGARSFTGIM
jgi:hypothetical protein